MTTKTNFSRITFLVFFGFFIALMVSEVGIRTLKWLRESSPFAKVYSVGGTHQKNDAYEQDDNDRRTYDRFALMRYSSFLGYFPAENHRGRGYVSNQYGFRYEGDFPIKKPRGEIRVFVTGGSTAWGAGASQENIFTTLAERAMQTDFMNWNIRVINAGVGAYLSTHERILILNMIKLFEPDIIVMFSGWNDTYAGYRGYRVVDDKWDYLGAAPILAEYNPQFSLGKPKIKSRIDPPRYGEYWLKTRYIIDRFLYGTRSKEQLEKSISEVRIEPGVVLSDLEDNIKIIADFSKRKDFLFVFYLQPSLYNSNKELSDFEVYLMEKGKAQYIGFPEYNSQIYDLYRKQLPLLASRERFFFVDGDDALADEKETVFEDHVHFGDRGNGLIAKQLVKITSELIKGKYGSMPTEPNTSLEGETAVFRTRQ